MNDSTNDTQAWHRTFAVACFNLTWDLLDKPDRTQAEADRMVHAAHASRYHWGEVGSPVEIERGEWQISRVYAVLGRAQPALVHAKRCLEICEANGIAGFDIAFAHEALARALALAGDVEASRREVAVGRDAAEHIADPDDRSYTLGELATVRELWPEP